MRPKTDPASDVTNESLQNPRYCVDSRLVQPGDFFVALKGERTDGHLHLEEVARCGAAEALVSAGYKGPTYLPLVGVKDPLGTLQAIAKQTLAERETRVIAVTGSVGKTTTKTFLHTLLKELFTVSASPGNYNSQIGLPLAILNHTKGDEEFLVLEMGMTEPGQIANLVQIAPPEIALITGVELVHAANFGSMEEIGRAKGEILSHPKTKLAIVNHAICDLVSEGCSCSIMTYSLDDPKADVFIGDLDFPELPVTGKHNLLNALGAASVLIGLGVPWTRIKAGLHKLKMPEGRSEIVEKGGITFINDAYNACTASIKAALETLPEGRRVAVIGGIVELGDFSEQCHREVGEACLEKVDHLFCFGPECGPVHKVWQEAGHLSQWTEDRQQLISMLRAELSSGDVVLLKGSNNKQLWKLLEEL